nr:zinc finger CCCH domain-containing protein 18-like isoform X3 [Coffea arabica]XP_027084698.1 zinc finger CCCH domain-containing protein 18-like isoform X3 [Coffea arabica]
MALLKQVSAFFVLLLEFFHSICWLWLHHFTNPTLPKCRCASSFYSNGVDLVVVAACHMRGKEKGLYLWSYMFFTMLVSRWLILCSVDVPISSLKQYIPTVWEQSLAGSSIWALQDAKFGIWREAELESWDEMLNLGHVVFRDDGSSAKLGVGALSLSEFAEVSDEEDSDLGSEETDSSDSGEDNSRGLGFLETTTSQKGIQTETAIFAKWENHTRGIASKMMASMGYRDGMGLGASGQGIVDPIPVKVLPPKQSLDHAVENQENEKDKENQGKKRSRGGKRKREKKFAAACRAAKEQEESEPDVFSLINTQLAKHGETLNGGSTKKQQNMANDAGRKDDRSRLVAYEDEVKELRMRVEKLEEMVIRNKKEKVVYEAAMRKLTETRKLLAEAEAAHASASSAVISKEKEKRWLKF